jgi:hypothetical protein
MASIYCSPPDSVPATLHKLGSNGKIAEDKLVALLDEPRRGGDVDHKGDAALLGDLCDGSGGAGIERTDQTVDAFLNRPLGPGARGVDVRLGIRVHQLNVHAEQVFEHDGGEIGAFLTRLADQALEARLGQQHADFKLSRLSVRAIERGQRGGAGGKEYFLKSSSVHLCCKLLFLFFSTLVLQAWIGNLEKSVRLVAAKLSDDIHSCQLRGRSAGFRWRRNGGVSKWI